MDTTREKLLITDECKGCDELRARLSDLLTRTINVLRGEPKPLHVWSWHDVPERAAALTAERDTLKALCVELADALYRFDHGDIHEELLTRARSILK